MVYYGKVSAGCQRCRQRKIKCDQRKPGCLRCERSKTQCPGFRNLSNVIFRDESSRIIRKARASYETTQDNEPRPFVLLDVIPAFSTSALPASTISHALSQPINEVGAHFFFTNFTCNEPPFSEDYNTWLIRMYREEHPNHALRAAIEAVGMAAVSNTFYAPDVASRSKEQYCRALRATKRALNDPIESTADTTLIIVIFLALFEFVTFEEWGRYAAHIEGATALVQLRGQEQFNHERGVQLFSQLRSLILYACVQRDTIAPESLLQITHSFGSSAAARVCFRLLDLRAAIKSGRTTDPHAIWAAAVEMDGDLEAWRASLEPSWSYTTVDAGDAPPGTYFKGKRHLYSHPSIANYWNNWRTLRILVNGLIFKNEACSDASGSAHESSSLFIIRQLSTEICISSPSFMGSPRSATLIWPLLVVSQEHLNPLGERLWAVEQLRRISSSMGIRHASLLADTISKGLNKPQSNLANPT